jgi:hypothetical protein
VINELGRIWKEALLICFDELSRCLFGETEESQSVIQICRCLGQDLQARPPEFESGKLITRPRRLLVETSDFLHYKCLKTVCQKYVLFLSAAKLAAVYEGSRAVTGPPVLLRYQNPRNIGSYDRHPTSWSRSKTVDLYSVGACFESRPGPRSFLVFLSPSRKMLGYCDLSIYC